MRTSSNIILAERCVIEDPVFWDHNRDVRLVIQATSVHQRPFSYPQKVKHVFVNPMNERNRSLQLSDAADEAIKVVRQGYDILIQCEKSVHRAPVVATALARMLAGVDGEACPPFPHSPSTLLSL